MFIFFAVVLVFIGYHYFVLPKSKALVRVANKVKDNKDELDFLRSKSSNMSQGLKHHREEFSKLKTEVSDLIDGNSTSICNLADRVLKLQDSMDFVKSDVEKGKAMFVNFDDRITEVQIKLPKPKKSKKKVAGG